MAIDIEWRTPAPLWSLALGDNEPAQRLEQPALLRFATDRFMDELGETLAGEPAKLADRVLRAETWLAEDAGWQDEAALAGATTPKLYQPVHGRFYLVSANLVCRKLGLPDHRANLGRGERVGFVLRRVTAASPNDTIDPADPTSFSEAAWISSGGSGHWQAISNGETLREGEELLPMFPVDYRDGEQPRRLWSGFIPTGSREPAPPPTDDEVGFPDAVDPRPDWFDARVGRPLNDLLRTAALPTEQKHEASLFWLLDCAELLEAHLSPVWTAVTGGAVPDNAEQARVYDVIAGLQLPHNTQLTEALANVYAHAEEVRTDGALSDGTTYDLTSLTHPAGPAPSGDTDYAASWTYQNLRPRAEADPGVYPDEAKLPLDLPDLPATPKDEADDRFWIRCVYLRPQCALDAACLVSRPSHDFRLGGFFDADAPARPINIQLPPKTGIAQLRRFKRAVSMTLSDQLRKQAERFRGKGVTDLEEGDLAEVPSGISFGMVCSLSIPIITICAMILLLIIVQLLNIVFWWLPYFKICLPRIR